jgi:hypothetical protein
MLDKPKGLKNKMLSLTAVTLAQAQILRMLLEHARDPGRGGRRVGASQGGYPVWHVDCDRAELARLMGLSSDDFVARKQLENDLETLTRARIISNEEALAQDCGPALIAMKCYRDPEGLEWIGFSFELPCLLAELHWSSLLTEQK